MFSRLSVVLTLTLALISQVHAHAVVSPALGVDGEPVRRDAQRPSRGDSRCGRVDVASNIDTSGAVTPATDGTMTLKVQNFNRGTDGSRQMTAMLDATGTGTSFNTPVTVVQNGDPRPRQARGSDTLVVQMPQGVTCTGGATGDKCLMSFESLGGFGNCVVVQQNPANTGAATNTGATANTGVTGTGTTGTATNTNTNNGGDNTAIPGNTGTGVTGNTGVTGTGVDNTGAVGNTGATGNTGVDNTGATANTGATGNTGAVGNTGATGNTAGATTGNTSGTVGTGSVGTSGSAAGAVVRRNVGGTRFARAVRHGVIA